MPLKFLVLFILWAPFAEARELYQSNLSLRSTAMGGTVNSWVRDSDAVLFNPAALAFIEKLDVKIAGISTTVGVSGEGSPLDIYNEWKDFGNISSPADYSRLSGKDMNIGANGKAGFAVPNFGFSLYTDNYILARFHSPPNPSFDTQFISDYGAAVGFAFNVQKDTSMGVTLKRINRWGGDKAIDLGVLLDSNVQTSIQNSFDSKGVGYGFDLGVLHTMTDSQFKPTFALTWQDVGSTAFVKTSGTTAPPRIQDNLSLGASGTVDLVGLDLLAAIEYKFINRTGEPLGKKIHTGFELSLPIVDLRVGTNQGYMTYGIGVDAFIFSVDMAFNPVEIGAYPGQTANNRFQVGISFDLSFDANFKLLDSNGRKRKLKQRR